MSPMTWAMLRELLVERYEDLRRRLARRLGSAELASETLHEAWIRLERSGSPGEVRNPEAYLLRVALNVASDRRRAEQRFLSALEVEALRHVDDDQLDPLRITEARSDIAALKEAFLELPTRCQKVFIAARIEELPNRVVAERLGLTVRTVERDLKRALEHFAQRLQKNTAKPVGAPPSQASSGQVGSIGEPSSGGHDRGSEHDE